MITKRPVIGKLYFMIQMDVCHFPLTKAGKVKRMLWSDWPIAGQICSVSKAENGTRSLSVLMDLDFAPSILFTS